MGQDKNQPQKPGQPKPNNMGGGCGCGNPQGGCGN